MKQIICIGESALDVFFRDGKAIGSMTAGRIANAAAILARAGLPVKMISEAAKGPIGDSIVDFLSSAGVDTASIDRFPDGEGLTPINIYTLGDNAEQPIVTRYEHYSDDCFDVIWPRIEAGDIIVFGGYYALDDRMHRRMAQLLEHAAERKAVLVYLPGFLPQQQPRITRVMPMILENLQYANCVVVRNTDLATIFGIGDGNTCYNDHISFYCRALIEIDPSCNRINYYSGDRLSAVDSSFESTEPGAELLYNAAAVAGIVAALYNTPDTIALLDNSTEDFRREVISSAATFASKIRNQA